MGLRPSRDQVNQQVFQASKVTALQRELGASSADVSSVSVVVWSGGVNGIVMRSRQIWEGY